jgi:hypothetical protein
LLLVLWLPAVGNLIAYFVKRLPRSAPPATDFAPDAAFAPQLQVQLEAVELPVAQRAALDGSEHRCTLLVGRHGFTARLERPLTSPSSSTKAAWRDSSCCTRRWRCAA